MKRIILIAMLATMLAGCIVVPAHPYYYRPAASVYIY
jgi:acyl-CoA synthetase (AMP-forming)/AMP-acid ligase II